MCAHVPVNAQVIVGECVQFCVYARMCTRAYKCECVQICARVPMRVGFHVFACFRVHVCVFECACSMKVRESLF